MDARALLAAGVAAVAVAGVALGAILARRTAPAHAEPVTPPRCAGAAPAAVASMPAAPASAPAAPAKVTSVIVSAAPAASYPPVGTPARQKRILVTGGAGFVGSNLVDALMLQGHKVYCLDNLFTGRKTNIQQWMGHPNFTFLQHDVVDPLDAAGAGITGLDEIYHLACPASPPHYQFDQVKTIKTSAHGTLNMLELAKAKGARLLLTSTSEIYGDPAVHPQPESYWGNVNTLGPRSCYDEGKRLAESLCYAFHHQHGVSVRIARIFNTYGPRMDPKDGRVVSNFIIQALKGEALTMYGSGEQTRSFQFITDLVRGLVALMNSPHECTPINLGNPQEFTMLEFAHALLRMIPGTGSAVVHLPPTQDDPKQRRPDISRARALLSWAPLTRAEDGFARTVEYFRGELGMAVSGEHPAAPPVWVPAAVDVLPPLPPAEPSPPASAAARGELSPSSPAS